ncbi:MAG: hypothetical protein DRJ43_01970, partial [Thermoprotei archaeon]
MGALTYAYLGTSVLLKRPELLERYGSFLSFIVVGMAYTYVIYASIAAPGEAINPWNLMWNLLVPAQPPRSRARLSAIQVHSRDSPVPD